MSYRLAKDETVLGGVRRIADEQVQKSIDEIKDQDLDRHETVHQVRKRCKKIRGLIRLVRPGFEETYQYENAWYRDAARELSYIRDAHSIIEIYEKIIGRYQAQLDLDAFEPLTSFLKERRRRISEDKAGIDQRLDEFRRRMEEGRSRIETWSLNEDGFDAVGPGLYKTYKRGRARFSDAYEEPVTENFHEWRKRVKYHWYHARLLRDVWEPLLDEYRSEVHLLSDYLGDMHDLSILSDTLMEHRLEIDRDDSIRALHALIQMEQKRLRRDAKILGTRIFCEKPDEFVGRFECYWQAWRGG